MERRTKSLGIERGISLWGIPCSGLSSSSLQHKGAGRSQGTDDPARRERGDIVSYIQVYKDGAAVAGNAPVHGRTGPRSFPDLESRSRHPTSATRHPWRLFHQRPTLRHVLGSSESRPVSPAECAAETDRLSGHGPKASFARASQP